VVFSIIDLSITINRLIKFTLKNIDIFIPYCVEIYTPLNIVFIKMTNYKTVFFALGILLIILGFFMIVPVIVQLIYDEFNGTFIYSSIVTIFIGTLFLLSNLDQDRKLNLQQAFLLTSLSWIGIAIFGSLPFIFSSLELTFSDAFFESMSGITTTGSTVIGDLNNT